MSEHRLTHNLQPHYPALRALRRRRDLLASPVYATIKDELLAMLSGIERAEHAAAASPAASDGETVRVLAWNIQRGWHGAALQQALRTDATLAKADVLLLSEVDCGLARSGNRNVARELAGALRMHYAFGVSYLTLGDDFFENPDQHPNTLALAGAAVLSRYPIGRVVNADLPELRDKFSSKKEKRLGKKRALLAEILLPEGPLLCATCHLDSNASPRQRAGQLGALLTQAEALGCARILVGGDMNSTTYDASGVLPLLRDLLHKLFVTGFRQTVEGYMVPEHSYEQPLFATLREHGFVVAGFNDRRHRTYAYDLHSPYAIAKLHAKVGRFLTWLLQRRLRSWNGVVPARLDWFAGRGLTPTDTAVVEARDEAGLAVSDHAAIVVDIRRQS